MTLRTSPIAWALARSVVAVCCVALQGCAEGIGDEDEPGNAAAGSESGAASPARVCPPPEGVSAAPQTVEEVVALLGALPQPTTLPCFLQSLQRPLRLVATTNAFSAQPSDGVDNPRMFIVSGPLMMSVVPTGVGRNLLEMAVDVGERESLKAELEFPQVAPVSAADPYDRIRQPGGGSTCNGCHGGERVTQTADGVVAFISEALQPPAESLVSIGFARQNAVGCDAEAEPDRCALLSALFDHGEVIAHTFPADTRICRAP